MQHPAVAFAGAIGQPDAHAGELPAAYVELVAGGDARRPRSSWRTRRDRIAEPAAVPKHLEVLPELPKTAVGKVFKPDLRRRAIARVFDAALAEARRGARVAAVVEDRRARASVAELAAGARGTATGAGGLDPHRSSRASQPCRAKARLGGGGDPRLPPSRTAGCAREADPLAAPRRRGLVRPLRPDRGRGGGARGGIGIDVPTRDEMGRSRTPAGSTPRTAPLFMTANLPSQVGHRPARCRRRSPSSSSAGGSSPCATTSRAPSRPSPPAPSALDLGCSDGTRVLVALLEAIVDRLADILETVGRDIERLSRRSSAAAREREDRAQDYRGCCRTSGGRATWSPTCSTAWSRSSGSSPSSPPPAAAAARTRACG